ncbi:uncharacterized protein si:ch211-13c6.2 isoform X1 [Osmerus eperlanus]|uniref:uncharacterized protein si:ch211-13c6.2 isoform X1 n=2 Tax=Osmerus eperlanus TaxID=29151 RepID=UPI002E1212C3
MDCLETTYEDSVAVEFIDCGICNKSIRGDTLYKIHLTTIQHIKREDSLVALGQVFRDQEVPDFKDIKEYFQFLNLDEPIIGLTHLDEVGGFDSADPQPGPRYICKLCDVKGNMPNMANHVVGRRHRQKYLEVKRKDLVTWDSKSILAQPGKVVRAKAQVVERQDGQGSPKPLRKNRIVGKSNLSKAPEKQRGNQNWPQGIGKPGFLAYPADRRDHHQESFSGNRPYPPLFHDEDAYGAERDEVHFRMDPQSRDYMEERVRTADYPEEDFHRQEFFEEHPQRRGYFDEMQRRGYPEEVAKMHGHPEDFPPRQAYPNDAHPEEVLRRRPYQENDPLKQFYSQEVQRRGAARSVEDFQDGSFRDPREPRGRGQPGDDSRGPAHLGEAHHPAEGSRYEDLHGRRFHEEVATGRRAPEESYTEDTRRGNYMEEEAHRRAYHEEDLHGLAYPVADPHRLSQERDPSGDRFTRAVDRQAQSAPDDNDLRYPKQLEDSSSYSQDHLFELVKAFRQKGRGQHQEERSQHQDVFERGDPGMRGFPQRPPEGGRVRSDIPEPFRRFLAGAMDDKSAGKRKRKSRFTDATDEEIDLVKRIQVDGHRGPRTDLPARPPGVYQGGNYTESSSKPMSDSSSEAGNVMDVLNNIEIENVEEANFLKEKLCSLLKEFQAKKSEKTAQESQKPGTISKDYNHKSNPQVESTRDHYERTLREMPEERKYTVQPRRTNELYFTEAPQGSYRGRGREEEGHMEKHGHTTRPESRNTSRSRYEDVFGQVEQYPTSSAQPEKSMVYHERPEDHVYQNDYPTAPEALYDHLAHTDHAHRERGYGMPSAPHLPTSLDKITSTLLELVARKS